MRRSPAGRSHEQRHSGHLGRRDGAALAIGFGLVPSASDLKRVEAKADRVEVAEREIAVQGQQIKEIKGAVQRIETRQTAQFDRIMRAIREQRTAQ